jgi:hypothetical protein
MRMMTRRMMITIAKKMMMMKKITISMIGMKKARKTKAKWKNNIAKPPECPNKIMEILIITLAATKTQVEVAGTCSNNNNSSSRGGMTSTTTKKTPMKTMTAKMKTRKTEHTLMMTWKIWSMQVINIRMNKNKVI